MSALMYRDYIRLIKLFNPLKSSRLIQYSNGLTTTIKKTKMRAKLEGDQRNESLKQLETSGWKLADDRDAISKTFLFKNFNQAFGFMTRVALLAEKLDHHPEWSNVYNKVQVTLSTHDLNGLSTYDVRMAQFMDKCISEITEPK